MSDVHGDPEALRALAHAIAEYANESGEGLRRLHGQLEEMGASTWSDDRYREFCQLFEPVEGQVRRALDEMAQEQCRFLEDCATKLDNYLGRG